MTTNVLLWDLDLGFVGSEADGRRLEICGWPPPLQRCPIGCRIHLGVCAAEGWSAHHPSRCETWGQRDKSTKAQRGHIS